MKRATLARCTAAAAASIVALGTLGAVPALAADEAPGFARTATYPVYLNVPAGVDPVAETVAEISAASPDGRTVVHTDALGKPHRLPRRHRPPRARGPRHRLARRARRRRRRSRPRSPIVGDYVLVVVDETGGRFTAPYGRLDVLRLSDRERVAQHRPRRPARLDRASRRTDAYAADRHREPARRGRRAVDGEEGGLPQRPAGFIQLIDLGGEPRRVEREAGRADERRRHAPSTRSRSRPHRATDPEPEYVALQPRTARSP